MNNRPIEDKKFSECNDYSSTVIELGYLFEKSCVVAIA